MKPPLHFLIVRNRVPVWLRGLKVESATPEECAEELSKLRAVIVETSRKLLLLHGTALSFIGGKRSEEQAKQYFAGSLAKI